MPSRVARGWCLRGPSGALYADTFDTHPDSAWSKSFDQMSYRFEWMRRLWKQWDESIAEAKRRKWELVRVELREVRP
jgi:hypothetical protein